MTVERDLRDVRALWSRSRMQGEILRDAKIPAELLEDIFANGLDTKTFQLKLMQAGSVVVCGCNETEVADLTVLTVLGVPTFEVDFSAFLKRRLMANRNTYTASTSLVHNYVPNIPSLIDFNDSR